MQTEQNTLLTKELELKLKFIRQNEALSIVWRKPCNIHIMYLKGNGYFVCYESVNNNLERNSYHYACEFLYESKLNIVMLDRNATIFKILYLINIRT